MRRWLAGLLGSCICLVAAPPASAQGLGRPVALSAEYAASLDSGPGTGVRLGAELRSFAGRLYFRPRARLSPWLATGLEFYRNGCGLAYQNCGENGWSNVAGLRADVLPGPVQRLEPYVLAGYGGVLTFDGSGGGLALAGVGLGYQSSGAIDPRVELRWERHGRKDYLMLALGANLLVRRGGSSAERQ